MGTVLSNWRLPVDSAVDVLTRRRWFDYVELVLEFDEPTYHIWEEPPDGAPQRLYFGTAYHLLIEALAGLHRGPYVTAHFDEEDSGDPRVWAIYGARLTGWETQDFPLRYSLSGDLDTVCNTLDRLTDLDLRNNIVHAHNHPPSNLDEYQASKISLDDRLNVFDEYLASRFLPVLQRFFTAAREESEIVIHWLH